MNRFLLCLFCGLFSTVAHAQVAIPAQIPSASGFVRIDRAHNVLLVAKPSMRATATGSVGMESVMFMAESGEFETDPLDVFALYAEYDCSTPGRWRSLLTRGFQQGEESHVFRIVPKPRWVQSSAGAIGNKLWTAACRPAGNYAPVKEDLTTARGRDAVLTSYRTALPDR